MLNRLLILISSAAMTIAGYQFINTKPQIIVQKTENISEFLSPISIKYLKSINIDESELKVEQELPDAFNYKKYIVSYKSEGYKVYGLLTIPKTEKPDGGYSAIIFNHGYIPPKQYSTILNYSSYVDYLAKNGFVVLKIDMRGHGKSEGNSSGSYFSSSYTKDAITAFKSLQKFEIVNPEKIGFWGHSMSGNLVLRAMLIENKIKAGVIWAGAVYSYEDLGKYKISDSSYRPTETQPNEGLIFDRNRDANPLIIKLRQNYKEIDFSTQYWSEISLTKNINLLNKPIQIHHSIDDKVVSVNYSRDLVEALKFNQKNYEYYEYNSGGHNISGVSFNQAMDRTVKFFRENLK